MASENRNQKLLMEEDPCGSTSDPVKLKIGKYKTLEMGLKRRACFVPATHAGAPFFTGREKAEV